MGSGVAAINLALILERNDIFSTDRGLLGTLGLKSLSSEFNINKQLAMKYLQFASYNHDTEVEASLKIAEFFYYGTSGYQSYKDAITIYKQVEDISTIPDIKGHAQFQLGMIHQFGNGVNVDNEVA